MPESDRPPVLLWAGLDRDLSPEIEAAICEVFPGDPERVHLATVRVMEVVLSRVPESGRIEGMSWCITCVKILTQVESLSRTASRV